MKVTSTQIDEAYRTLGLPAGAPIGDAKEAFRARVKSLHPDRTPPTEATLNALSDAIAAMRCIESRAPFTAELDVPASVAQNGATRLVSCGLRWDFVRIPPGTTTGTVLHVVGDTTARITIRIRETEAAFTPADESGHSIESFVRDFAAPSPAARFARWIRGPRSAA